MAKEEMKDETIVEETVPEQDVGNLTITFKKPVEYNGKTYEKLTFDFESLTGKDSLDIDEELDALGKTYLIPAFSAAYLVRMAAKACSDPVGHDIFEQMSLRDFQKVKDAARRFLLRQE